MKVKRYLEFTAEGLKDLQFQMRSTGQSKQFSPYDFNREEILDIESMNGIIIDNRTAELANGEMIVKSPDGYSLKSGSTELIFIRMSRFKTIPSDWEVFRNQLESYLQKQSSRIFNK